MILILSQDGIGPEVMKAYLQLLDAVQEVNLPGIESLTSGIDLSLYEKIQMVFALHKNFSLFKGNMRVRVITKELLRR